MPVINIVEVSMLFMIFTDCYVFYPYKGGRNGFRAPCDARKVETESETRLLKGICLWKCTSNRQANERTERHLPK